MSLDDLYMRKPAGRAPQLVTPLGPMPGYNPLTPAQIAQRQAARRAQVGKLKTGNRFHK